MRKFVVMSCVALGLAACEVPTETPLPTTSPAWLAIVDRELVRPGVTAMIRSDGTITGTGIEGVWAEREGYFCRTLTLPTQNAGAGCLTIRVEGDQVTFDTQGAGSSTWTLK